MNEEIQKAKVIQDKLESISNEQKTCLTQSLELDLQIQALDKQLKSREIVYSKEINSAVDESGKKKYSNEKMRSDALFERCASEEEYIQLEQKRSDLDYDRKVLSNKIDILSKEKHSFQYIANLQCAILGVKYEN